jgi:hypothetical protein
MEEQERAEKLRRDVERKAAAAKRYQEFEETRAPLFQHNTIELEALGRAERAWNDKKKEIAEADMAWVQKTFFPRTEEEIVMTIRTRTIAEKEYNNCGRELRKVELPKQEVEERFQVRDNQYRGQLEWNKHIRDGTRGGR